ncbi:MAG TPA: hypothetical protein VNH17_12515 [Streptosporangiaceae bacterium]|nr:hypothetical protein [Streptosporangiaceae bacterium]
MGYESGTADVGEDLVPLCGVPDTGVQVKNKGGTTVYLGGSGLPGDGSGFPLDPGDSELIQGMKPKESPVVPAPEGDIDAAVLYARTAPGTGIARVSWITVTLT